MTEGRHLARTLLALHLRVRRLHQGRCRQCCARWRQRASGGAGCRQAGAVGGVHAGESASATGRICAHRW